MPCGDGRERRRSGPCEAQQADERGDCSRAEKLPRVRGERISCSGSTINVCPLELDTLDAP